jgi:hypothetical protein
LLLELVRLGLVLLELVRDHAVFVVTDETLTFSCMRRRDAAYPDERVPAAEASC